MKINLIIKKRIFNFRNNNIKGVINIIKKMQKKGDFIGLYNK